VLIPPVSPISLESSIAFLDSSVVALRHSLLLTVVA
jgi:hypothetical protein